MDPGINDDDGYAWDEDWQEWPEYWQWPSWEQDPWPEDARQDEWPEQATAAYWPSTKSWDDGKAHDNVQISGVG